MGKKTYIAPGLLDLRLVVRAGKAWTTVDFTGGRTSGYSNCQAHYTTADKVMQRMIENCPEFKSGKVVLKRL